MPRSAAPSRDLLLALAVVTALLIAGCGDDEQTSTAGSTETEKTATTNSTVGATDASEMATDSNLQTGEAEAAIAAPDGNEVDLYFTSGEQFERVPREVLGDSDSGEAQLEAAAEELVAGPTAGEKQARIEVQTAIPPQTEVESVSLEADGTAEVELSPAFLRGVPPRAEARDRAEQAELDARIGQIAHTLGQFEQVRATKVISGGVSASPPVEPREYRAPSGQPKALRKGGGGSGKNRGGSSSVRRLQDRLAKLRYLPRGAVDGVNGYRTQQAVIAFQSWEKLDRDGVAGPMTKAALETAKPPKPKLGGPSKRLEVYREKGVLLLVKGDETKRAIHVSTGAPGTETPRGRYEVFRKELKSWSVPFQTWLPYASYFFQGIAFHEYPDVPTYPASHGCVRVPAPEAPKVYEFAALGTAVAVR